MRQPSLPEQKLVILFSLDKLGACTALQLLRFLVENQLMDYIEMQIATAEMAEAGLLRKLEHELGILYSPSELGRQTMELFAKKIPHSRRAQIEQEALTWKARFRKEKQVLGDFSKDPDGEYQVHLRLLEQELTLLDLKLSVPTREQANLLLRHWPARADVLYGQLIETLCADVQGEED